MESKVVAHRQIKVKRLLLEHHTDTCQRFCRMATQVNLVDADIALIGHEQTSQQLQQR